MMRDAYASEAREQGAEWEEHFPVFDFTHNDNVDEETNMLPEGYGLGVVLPRKTYDNSEGGENEMSESQNSFTHEGLEYSLLHEGAQTYRDSELSVRNGDGEFSQPDTEQTIALGAANYLHRSLNGENIEESLDEVASYVRENDLEEVFNDYKNELPDDSPYREAATGVVDVLGNAEDLADQSVLYRSSAEEVAQRGENIAHEFFRVAQAAEETPDFSDLAGKLRNSRENVLGPAEQTMDDIADSLDDMDLTN